MATSRTEAPSFVEGEADLERHLVVPDLPVDYLAPHLHDLEPSDVPDILGGPADRISDGVGDAFRGSADKIDDLVVGTVPWPASASRFRMAAVRR
ncbi:hypothetical protein GCM10011504_29280 [Siccirubricoccus deserti]|nr:hypothetical protein GCM10011504_29280 [Siccirubricoccus deserti]